MSKTKKNNLQVIDVIESAGLEQDTTKTLRDKFLPFWEQAEQWKKKAEGLVVTDESQTSEMKMARVARLALRQVRIDADKTRKALKEDSIRYGRAVQGVYNVIEYMIKPIEDHLLQQEQFVEIRQQEARDRLNEDREQVVSPLSEFIDYSKLPATNAPWADLTVEQFSSIVNSASKLKKAHEEEQARLEAERIAKEAEDKRIREENAKLKAEAIERERAAAEERRALEEQARKEREEAEAKAAKEREEAAARLAAERAKREALEAEARRKEEEAMKAKQAEEEARRKAEQAPDKEKLLAFAADLSSLDFPAVTSMNAREIVKEYSDRISALASSLRAEAEQL